MYGVAQNRPCEVGLRQSINCHSQYTKMRLRNMLRICLVFWETEPQYAYKRYA